MTQIRTRSELEGSAMRAVELTLDVDMDLERLLRYARS